MQRFPTLLWIKNGKFAEEFKSDDQYISVAQLLIFAFKMSNQQTNGSEDPRQSEPLQSSHETLKNGIANGEQSPGPIDLTDLNFKALTESKNLLVNFYDSR